MKTLLGILISAVILLSLSNTYYIYQIQSFQSEHVQYTLQNIYEIEAIKQYITEDTSKQCL